MRNGNDPFPAHALVNNALNVSYFRLNDFQACTLLGVVRPNAATFFYVVEVVYYLKQGHTSPVANTLYVHPDTMKDTFSVHPHATHTNWIDPQFIAELPIFALSTAFTNVLARYVPTKTMPLHRVDTPTYRSYDPHLYDINTGW